MKLLVRYPTQRRFTERCYLKCTLRAFKAPVAFSVSAEFWQVREVSARSAQYRRSVLEKIGLQLVYGDKGWHSRLY